MSVAVGAIITLPLSGIQAHFSASFAGWLVDVSPPRCDDSLLPWDVYGLHKEQVLKRL